MIGNAYSYGNSEFVWLFISEESALYIGNSRLILHAVAGYGNYFLSNGYKRTWV